MSHILEIWGIATVTGISCSLIGTFLVLRRLSMMVDAITHTVFFRHCISLFGDKRFELALAYHWCYRYGGRDGVCRRVDATASLY